MSVFLTGHQVDSLLKQHHINIIHIAGHPVPGIRAIIEGVHNLAGEKNIAISIAHHRAERLWPIGQYEAQTIVDELHRRGLVPADEHVRRTLEHLLVHSSSLYDVDYVQAFRLGPLFLDGQGYTLRAATITAARHPHVVAPLAGDAHDRKAAAFGKKHKIRVLPPPR